MGGDLFDETQEETQGGMQFITSPEHAHFDAGRGVLQGFVNHTIAVLVLYRGGDERDPHVGGDQADDGLHEPGFLRDSGHKASLETGFHDVREQTGHGGVTRWQHEPFFSEFAQGEILACGQGVFFR